ncbi:MAG: orotidine-5'-phosphate decarboxylase [Deltaproteobacteria bacterium]|nr:orotidine-5'-phosphate decarboxylase [Deltaproteobacteria bacterium]
MHSISRDDARRRLIFALDVPDLRSGIDILQRVEGQVGVVKIGLELFTACGPSAVEEVMKRGFDVFLDLKLHDIPNTVKGAVRMARSLGVSMLTIHTGGGEQMMSRAAEEAGDGMTLLGVTLLTSLGAEDLEPVAILPKPTEVVQRRAALAAKSGLGGIVCSPKEIKSVRDATSDRVAIVTPGIRPPGAELGDQKRAATPDSAIADGADYLVVGRPIRTANDPAATASSIVDAIAKALTAR